MKKIKLVALLMAASMALTACGTNGEDKEKDIFSGLDKAIMVDEGGIYEDYAPHFTCDKNKIREMSALINAMDYKKVDYEEIPQDVRDGGTEMYIDFEITNEDRAVTFFNEKYCQDVKDNAFYEITSPDENTYEKLKQMNLKIEHEIDSISMSDYENQINSAGKTDTVTTDKVQLDTANPNYTEWAKGICCNIAQVPDKGDVRLVNNDYKGYESAYRIDNVTKDDFTYLVDKYKKAGFNQNVVEEDVGFIAYSESSVFDYVSISIESGSTAKDNEEMCLLMTVGGDLNCAGTVTAGWEDGTYSKAAPKPETGDCYLLTDRVMPYPWDVANSEDIGNHVSMSAWEPDDTYSEYIVYNADLKQACEYIELCKSNGYTDDDTYDIGDGDNGNWRGVSADDNYIVDIRNTGEDFTIVTVIKK